MSETALPNNENNHPKPEKARGGVGKILSFPDKVGSHVFHNVIGIGKFGKLEEILGNPSGEVIKNVKNRLAFLDVVEKKIGITTLAMWAQLKHIIENTPNLTSGQIINCIVFFLNKIKTPEAEIENIIQELENIKTTVEIAEGYEKTTQIGSDLYNKSVRDKIRVFQYGMATLSSLSGIPTGGLIMVLGNTSFARQFGQEAMKIRISEIIDMEVLNKLGQQITENEIPSNEYEGITNNLRKLAIYCVSPEQRKKIVQLLALIARNQDSAPDYNHNLYNKVMHMEKLMQMTVKLDKMLDGKQHQKIIDQSIATVRTTISGLRPLAVGAVNLVKKKTGREVTEQSETSKKKAELFGKAAIGWLTRVGVPVEIANKFDGVGKVLGEAAGKVGEVASGAWENVSNVIPQIPEILQAPINKMTEIPMGIQHTTLYNSIKLNGWNMDAINQYLAVNGVNNSAMADQIGSIIDEIKTQTPGLSREQILQKAMPEIADLAQENGYDDLATGTRDFLADEVPKAAETTPPGFEQIVQPGKDLVKAIDARKFAVSIVAAVSALAGFAAGFGKKKEVKLGAGFAGTALMGGAGMVMSGNPFLGAGVGAGAVAAGFITSEGGKKVVKVAQEVTPKIKEATGAVAGVAVEKSREFAGNAGQYVQEARANVEEVIGNGKQYVQGVTENVLGLGANAKTKFSELTQGSPEQRAAKYKTQLDELKKSFEIFKQNSQTNQELEGNINQLSRLVHHFLRATNSENQSANPSSIPQPKEIEEKEVEIRNLFQTVQNSLKLARKPVAEKKLTAEKKNENNVDTQIQDFFNHFNNVIKNYEETEAYKNWAESDDILSKFSRLKFLRFKNGEANNESDKKTIESEIKALLKDLYKEVKIFEKSQNPGVDVLGKLKERAGKIIGDFNEKADYGKFDKIMQRYYDLGMRDQGIENVSSEADDLLKQYYYGETVHTTNGNTVVIEPNKSENLKNEIKAKLAELEKLVTDLEKNRKQQKPKSQEPTFLDKLKERAKRMAKRHAGEKKRAEKEKKKEKKSSDKEIQDFFKKLKQVAKDYKAGEVYKKWIDSDSVWPKFLELTDLIGANTQLESMIQEKEAGNPNDLLSGRPLSGVLSEVTDKCTSFLVSFGFINIL